MVSSKSWKLYNIIIVFVLIVATQMWCLARLLPLIIGSNIPQNEPHWENFLLMLTITDYLFAPAASKDIAAYLKSLIQEHHEAFCTLYPAVPIIPKQHYVIHLPEWLLRCSLWYSMECLIVRCSYIHCNIRFLYVNIITLGLVLLASIGVCALRRSITILSRFATRLSALKILQRV